MSARIFASRSLRSSVFVAPGDRMFRVTPLDPTSCAIDFVSATTPPFAAA
jgi:hypothetical protein